jgi:hypothetical protein
MYGDNDEGGIIYRAVRQIISAIDQNKHTTDFTCEVQFVEIYNDALFDLLATDVSPPVEVRVSAYFCFFFWFPSSIVLMSARLPRSQEKNGSVFLKNAITRPVVSYEDFHAVITEGLSCFLRSPLGGAES